MKYGLLVDFGLENCNFGDYAQTIAIEYLYSIMNIPESEIIHLTYMELRSYEGDQLLLPYCYVLSYIMNPETEKVVLSDNITPLFLSVSIGVGFTRPTNIFTTDANGWMNLFQKASPIGCRDEATCNFFKSIGIPSYLQGCITNILPRRPSGNYYKVLLVDCPIEILTYIPKDLLEYSEVLNNAEDIGELNIEENYFKIKKRYEYYRNNASLVVTSRYHVATPCNAMGIPSILLMRPFKGSAKDIRLDSLNPNIQLYSSAEYGKINWYPLNTGDNSELKTDIICLAISRIHEALNLYALTKRIHKFFEPRILNYVKLKPDDTLIMNRFHHFLESNYKLCSKGKFYIWAASILLCRDNIVPLADEVRRINPNLEFEGWIDTYKTGVLAEKPIINPSELILGVNDFIIVATGTVIPFAMKLFNNLNLKQKQYFIFFDRILTEEDLSQARLQS